MKHGRLDIMSFLEDNLNWDIKTTNLFNDDAYLIAADNGHLDIMIYLENKYNWNIYTNNNGEETAYLIAASSGHLDIMKHFLEKHRSIYNNLINSISIKHNKAETDKNPKFLASKKWSIFDRDESGDDAYLLAASGGHTHIMEYLEKTFDWDIHTTNKTKTDAYLIGAYNGSLKTLKYLEEKHNWNIKVTDKDGDDAFLTACYTGNINVIKYLEEKHNWDINVTNSEGSDGYFIAKKYENHELMDYLYKKILPNRIKKDFQLVKDKILNDKCLICQEIIVDSEEYCKCHNNHILHRSCFIDYLVLNNLNSDYRCIYCRDHMYRCSFMFKAKK